MKRKLIAVGAIEIDTQYHKDMINGIVAQANLLGYNVAVFTMLLRDQSNTLHQLGESNIFNLINYNLVDGIIFADYDYGLAVDYYDDIMNLIKYKAKCPVISIDRQSKYFDCIVADDKGYFKRIVDHVIEEHGCKKLYCLTGGTEHFASLARLEAFKESLTEHNLPFSDEENVFHGNFWIDSARKFAARLIKKEIPMPDAVICANDHMAIQLTNSLTDSGIKIPQDIIITGYDGVDDAKENIPSVTTYSVSGFHMGIKGAVRMHKILTGEDIDPIPSEPGELAVGMSCNCDIDFTFLMNKRKKHLMNIRDVRYNDYDYARSNMANELTNVSGIEECSEKIFGLTFMLKRFKSYYLCLGEDWDSDSYKTEGYHKNMKIFVAKERGINCFDNSITSEFTNMTFKKELMFPSLWDEYEDPMALYFTPIHFNDRCFGYSVIAFLPDSDYDTGLEFPSCNINAIYVNWNRNIDNALEFIRIRKNLNIANSKLYMASVRDALTGIYNRNGYYEKADKILQKAKDEHKKLLLISADVDGLKPINDNYGHLEGDIIISAAANVLNSVCSENEICARTGGDEFLIIGCDDYDDEQKNKMIDTIADNIDEYNKKSDKPYKLQISLGVYCDYPKKKTTLHEITESSDSIMYRNKLAHKRRINGL